MNKQDEEKARELSHKWIGYYRNSDVETACLEMAAWKEKQMMDTFKTFVNRKFHKGDAEMLIRDFKKAMGV